MFTGIVEELGRVRGVRRADDADLARLEIDCAAVLTDAAVGDSVNVNGCCVTITSLRGAREGFTADLMGETLRRTALGALAPGDEVNLERALRADDRLGGHVVTGHVDAVAQVRSVRRPDRAGNPPGWVLMDVGLPPAVAPYVAAKGSVTVDGASLTVVDVDAPGPDAGFRVGLIPHTLAVTVLGRRRPGDLVNLEADVLAKYVERLLLSRGGLSPTT